MELVEDVDQGVLEGEHSERIQHIPDDQLDGALQLYQRHLVLHVVDVGANE